MIQITFSAADLDLSADQAATVDAGGALDADNVYFQYICSTASGHDPNEEPDDKVRDSHRALHGTIWRVDDPLAPIPPHGYGCRCGARFVGAPKSLASQILGAAAETKPTTVPDAFTEWLGKSVPKWRKYLDAAEGKPAADKLGAIYLALKEGGQTGDLREIARMIATAGGIL